MSKSKPAGYDSSITGVIRIPHPYLRSMPKQVKLLDSELKLLESIWTSNNQFAFAGMLPGTYLVVVELTGGKSYQQVVSLEGGPRALIFALPAEIKQPQRHSMLTSQKIKKKRSDQQHWFLVEDTSDLNTAEIRVSVLYYDVSRPDYLLKTIKVNDYSCFVAEFEFDSDSLGKVFLFESELFRPKLVSCPPGGHLRITLKREKSPIHSLQVNVTTANYAAETILALIENGGIKDALKFMNLEQAENLLQQKKIDCSAAAIGGYYLLKAGELPRLHDWANNLANWFPDLPDGAIIHAWQLISQQVDSIGQNYLIRERLLQALRRGIPVYTEGLRLLYDGLQQLVQIRSNDLVVENALLLVRNLYSNADQSVPVTTINNFDLDRGHLGSRSGLYFPQNIK